MAHLHDVRDSESRFIIDPVTRTITSESAKKKTVIQGDHNSERFTFEIPCVDGHDMSICNKVEIHYINIDGADTSKKSPGVYEADDLTSSGDVVTFTWLLSRTGTQHAGTLNFLVHFACIVDGVEEYAWNTGIFQGITVGTGMNNGTEEAIEPYLDVLAQWKTDLFGIGDTEEQRLLAVSQEQQEIIAATGHAVLETIPDEYEELSNLVDQNHRNKAGAIVLDSEGENIVVNDASEYPLQGLKLFGKSTQDGTPTPDAPVDIVSLENPVVMVCGKNLLENTLETKTHLGCDIVVNNDGSVVINGTATSEGTIAFNKHIVLPTGTYTLSGEKVVAFLRAEDNTHKQTFFTGATITIEDTTDYLLIGVYANKGQVFDNLKTYPMLRLEAETDGSFELHKEAQTIAIPHTLPGVPVSSGGNYTDGNGQQWICDEVDLTKGVYVQRIGAVVANLTSVGTLTKGKVYSSIAVDNREKDDYFLCSHAVRSLYYDSIPSGTIYAIAANFVFVGNETDTLGTMKEKYDGATIIYKLANPIETPLSDAELTAFKALHTNKPNTTILNDSGAYMSVEYVADTKTYIDNKIAEYLKGSE